jgi:hypothetical protein
LEFGTLCAQDFAVATSETKFKLYPKHSFFREEDNLPTKRPRPLHPSYVHHHKKRGTDATKRRRGKMCTS